METTGLVLQLYRAQFGEIPLPLAQDFGPLDVVAALTADASVLTVGVVNPTESSLSMGVAVDGRQLGGRWTRWQLAAAEPGAHNVPGRPRAVDIHRLDRADAAAGLDVAGLSCAVFRVALGE
jgi:hypothetical protein